VQAPSAQLIDAYASMAEQAASDLVADVPRRQRLVGCAPTGAGDTACLQRFIRGWGRKAFRRPLAEEEVQAFTAVAAAQANLENDFWEGLRTALEVMLQAPSFLYREDRGTPAAERPGLVLLDDYSVASRLSFYLWNRGPDDALLALAAEGGLRTREQVAQQVDRMLVDPRAGETIREFYRQWLALDGLLGVTRDPVLYPDFSPALVASMQEETLRTLEDAAGTDFMSVVETAQTQVDPALARLYGVPAPAAGFTRVTLPPERRGLLGQASFLTNGEKRDGTSPTRRGLLVQKRLLCTLVPPPPANAGTVLPPVAEETKTARQRLAAHASNPSCSGCHVMMDGIGLGLEKFDAIGRYRETENGAPIDDSGQLVLSGVRVPFTGAAELSSLLRKAPETRRCLEQHFVRWSMGRRPAAPDQALLEALDQAFTGGGQRFQVLLKTYATSDAFRFAPQITD
jgi:hypothetical protein